MSRRKSPAQPAPQTLEEAIVLLTRYSTIDAGIAQLEANRQAAIAAVNAEADKVVAPYEIELQGIVKQLKPWWAVVRDEMTDGGKRKSIKLGGCLIGYRVGNPTLTFEGKSPKKGTEAEDRAIAALDDGDRADLVRVKHELDREALLKALVPPVAEEGKAIDPEVVKALDALVALGFGRKQREEFFVDRIPPKPADVAEVPDPEADEVTA